ncbi:MAG: energy transducer TonB, partial [Bacteroidota bacterium]
MKVAWDNCINENRVELVFVGRNKDYGAYEIRKKYSKTLLVAFLSSTAAIIFLICLPMILKLINESVIQNDAFTETEVTLMQPPPIDESQP